MIVDSGGVPYRYDWRTKAEPILWVADAICGVTAEHLLGGPAAHFDRLAKAGAQEAPSLPFGDGTKGNAVRVALFPSVTPCDIELLSEY